MTCIHGNKLNKIHECNLLQNVLNPPKGTKNQKIYYSPIIKVYMNIQKGKGKFKNSSVLFDNGCSYTIIIGMLITN